jgi:hypothetical protein
MSMKKTVSLLLIPLLVATAANAINLSGKGVKAGLNLTRFTGDFYNKSEMILNYSGGVFIETPLSPRFSFQVELLFMRKGDKEPVAGYVVDSLEFFYEDVTRLTYLEIPLLVKFKPHTNSRLKPAVFAGPAVSCLINAVSDEYDSTIQEVAKAVNIRDDLKALDLGIVAGAGFTYLTRPDQGVTFDFRYTLGMIKIDDSEGRSKARNMDIAIMVGYSF